MEITDRTKIYNVESIIGIIKSNNNSEDVYYENCHHWDGYSWR